MKDMMEGVRKKISNIGTEGRVIWGFSLSMIAFAFYICFLLYATKRSLWVDEAMLAYSFSKRSIFDLTGSIFEWNQSAPIIYLYIVKIITMVFGNTEMNLRIFSLFAYIGTLVCVYVVLDKIFKVKYPILGTAFVSTMKVLLYYSNEFKPYMNDCLCCLLVVIFYYLYRQKKIKFLALTLIYLIFPWISYPSLFLIGGVCIYEWSIGIIGHQKNEVLKWTAGGMAILAGFAIYYFYWLRPVANQEYMIDFWVNNKFPLFPASLEDIVRVIKLSGALLISMQYGMIFIALLTISGVVITVSKRNPYAIVMTIGVLLSLLASYLGKYPFHYRLMLFLFPIMVIFMFSALDVLMKNKKGWQEKTIVICLIAAIFLSNYGTAFYLNSDKRIRSKNEANGLINYLDENIESGEMLYVYRSAVPVMSYKNGYDSYHIGENINQDIENVIIGEGHFDEDFDFGYIERILAVDKCYVLMVHYSEERIKPLMEALMGNGYLEVVDNIYDTLLYFHTNDVKNIKTKIRMDLLSHETIGDSESIEIEITNVGESLFNVEDINDIYISSKEAPELAFRLEKHDVKPNDSFVFKSQFKWPSGLDTLEFQLVEKDKYWFDEIGTQAITIVKED